MRQRSTKGKMLEILTKLTNHPFAVPFAKNEQTTHNSMRTLCEIITQTENNKYEDTQEVVKDIVSILENNQSVKSLEYVKEHLEEDDIDIMATSLEKRFFQLYNETFDKIKHE